MEGLNSVACPVCTLYMRPGISLESHLTSHPKQKVIEALIRVSQLGPQNADKVPNNECNSQPPSGMAMFPPMNVNANLNQVPTNHSFIYQQFMSSSGTQPILNVNPMNQQFVAVPAVFNPQMVCSPPYIFQQQQQVQIVSAGANIQPFIPRAPVDMFPSSNPAICSAADAELQDPLCTTVNVNSTNSPSKSTVVSVNSSPVSSVNDKPYKTQSVHETNSDKLLTITTISNCDQNPISIPEDLEDEDKESNRDTSDGSTNIILETNDDDVVSVHINIAHEAEDVKSDFEDDHDKQQEDELNKACQTTTLTDKDIHNEISDPESANNVGEVLIANEHKIYDESDAVLITPNNDYETVQEDLECASGSGLQNNDTVTVLEMDDMNFILPNDFMQNGQSIISKVNDIECMRETNRDDRPHILMNIGVGTMTSTNILMNISNDKCIVGAPDYDEDKYIDDKLDDECVSRESLNIRADERMPPRGELSEQESNGASEVGWGSRIYQEGSSGMSTSYDLLARESWEASDCSDSEMPPLQSRIQPSIDYSQEDVDEPEPEETEEKDVKSPQTFDFNCTTCGQTFRCPKERRVHQAKEHASSSSSAVKKTLKKRVVRTNIKKEKADNKLDIYVKDEDVKFELPEGKENDFKKDELDLGETKDNFFLCNSCGELLSSLKELNIHNKKVHNIRIPSPNLTCKICNEAFQSPDQYTEHLKVHPLECNICGKHFYKAPNLKMHLKRHAGVRPHKCEICSKAFFAKQKLREHLNIHTGTSPIKCTLCDETFRRYSNLVQHRNRHHLKIRKIVKDYICHCGEIYHTKNKLNWHKETHEPKPKSCKYCNEKFIHRASLTRHIRRTHNQRYVPEDHRDNENVECKICKGIYLKSSLEAHLYTHTGKKQHSCPICSKEFSTKWNLKLHKWTHAAPTSKPYKCETCNSAFVRQSDYTSHMNSHRSIRPYTCNYCGCKFIRKYNCVRHVREHEEGKSYNCGVCNKSFHRSYYLKEHMRVHTGVRPFSCHICGKTSTTKSNHNKHMKIHHAREPVMTEG